MVSWCDAVMAMALMMVMVMAMAWPDALKHFLICSKYKMKRIGSPTPNEPKTRYLYRGFVLRSQLLVLLKKKAFSFRHVL